MQKGSVHYKSKASLLVILLVLMSLTAIVGSNVNAEEARNTGNEQISVAVLSDHYDELSSITVGATLTGLNPGIDYDLSLTICYDMSNIGSWQNPPNGFSYDDYSCNDHMVDALLYDAENDVYLEYLWEELIDIPVGVNSYAIAKAIEFQRYSDVHPDHLGQFTCNDASTISNWLMVNDGVDDCPDASDETFDFTNWPTEIVDASYFYNCTDWSKYGWDQPSLQWTWTHFDSCGRGFYVVAELMVGDYELVDSYSNSFAIGYRGQIEFDSLRESAILSGMDYEFSFGACKLFHYISDLVEYDLEYSVQNLDDMSITHTGTHSQIDSRSKTASCSPNENIALSNLADGNYSLTISLIQEGILLEQYVQDFSVVDIPISGAESLTLTTNSHHYNSDMGIMVVQGHTENIVWGQHNGGTMDPIVLDLRLCNNRASFSFPLTSSGTTYNDYERHCSETQRPLIYDAQNDTYHEEFALRPYELTLDNIVSGVFYLPLYSEYDSEIHPNNLGQFTCDDSSTINDWWMVNDGVADCADGSDEGFDYADWPNETISGDFASLQGGYWFEGTLMSGDFVLVDAFSNSFAAGDKGSVQYKALHPDGVLNGMDYEFDFRARWLFRYIDTLVDYDLNYTVTDSNSNIVASGTHTQIDSRSRTAWASGWETVSISGLNIGDYILEINLNEEGEKISSFTQDFSIIDETLSGNEVISVSVNSNHYDEDEDIELTVSLDNLFPGTNYDINWKMCRDTFELDQYPNPANGTIFERYDCPNTLGNGPQIYDASTDSYSFAWDIVSPVPSGSTSFSETVVIHSEYTSHMDPWQLGDYECNNGNMLSMGWLLINDGVADCADGSDEGFDYADWPTEIIPNMLANYIEQEGIYILAEITVAGFEVVDAYTDSFAVGTIGNIHFSSGHESGVLAGMDYKFNYRGCELFRYINTPIDYNLDYWVFDEFNGLVTSGSNQLIDSRGMGSDCSSSELVAISGLTVDQGKRNKHYSLKIMLTSQAQIVDELELDFTITDPMAPNDDATISVNALTGGDGVGVVDITVEGMTPGQYYEVIYTVGMAGGQPIVGNYIIIAPPLSDTETIRFPELHDGFYCVNAKLMIYNWELKESSECFSQSSTIDRDGDGIRDLDDECPDEDARLGPDLDGDGCIEYPDSDFDGWDDVVEIECGTDPTWSEEYPIDTDGDGICDALDTDSDNDGVPDIIEIAEGTNPLDAQSMPNAPPVCDIYFAFETSGVVIVNDNLLISAMPAGTPTVPMNITVTLPVGNYYLIAMCSDSDGDLVSVNMNGEIIGPMSEAIIGALVVMAPDTSETVDLVVAYDDGIHFLAAQITVNLDATSGIPSIVDETTGQGVPGFTGLFSLIALIGAASLNLRKRK